MKLLYCIHSNLFCLYPIFFTVHLLITSSFINMFRDLIGKKIARSLILNHPPPQGVRGILKGGRGGGAYRGPKFLVIFISTVQCTNRCPLSIPPQPFFSSLITASNPYPNLLTFTFKRYDSHPMCFLFE